MVNDDQYVKVLNDWITFFCQQSKIAPMSLSANHQLLFSLPSGQEFVLSLNAEDAYIHLIGLIGEVQTAPSRELLRDLMILNHQGQTLDGCKLGLNEQLSRFSLSFSMPLTLLDQNKFFNLIHNFLATSIEVEQKIIEIDRLHGHQAASGRSDMGFRI